MSAFYEITRAIATFCNNFLSAQSIEIATEVLRNYNYVKLYSNIALYITIQLPVSLSLHILQLASWHMYCKTVQLYAPRVHNQIYTCYYHALSQPCTNIYLVETNECSPLKNPANGSVVLNEDATKARFHCKRGFTIQGEDTLVCKDGKWSSWPPICSK